MHILLDYCNLPLTTTNFVTKEVLIELNKCLYSSKQFSKLNIVNLISSHLKLNYFYVA